MEYSGTPMKTDALEAAAVPETQVAKTGTIAKTVRGGIQQMEGNTLCSTSSV